MHDLDNALKVSGAQIAFLMLAVALLAVPAALGIVSVSAWARENESVIGRLIMLAVAITALAGFPALRRWSARMLARPITPSHRLEVWMITLVAVVGNFAAAGGVAAWLWLQGGDALLASQMKDGSDAAIAKTLSGPGLPFIVLAWVVGPVVEELLFRGLLYQAWARRWHWLIAATLTATIFGIYHPFFIASFCYSILFTCIVRRTGSLRSAIIVHAVSNASLWFPFLGQFVFPVNAGENIARLSTWRLHLASLIALAVFLPLYVWMSRDRPLRGDVR